MNDHFFRDPDDDSPVVGIKVQPSLEAEYQGIQMRTSRGSGIFPEVGFVYPAKGGMRGSRSPTFWVVVSVIPNERCPDDLLGAKVVMLGYNDQGEICSSQTYNAMAVYDRKILGVVNVNLALTPREI